MKSNNFDTTRPGILVVTDEGKYGFMVILVISKAGNYSYKLLLKPIISAAVNKDIIGVLVSVLHRSAACGRLALHSVCLNNILCIFKLFIHRNDKKL